ncbi:hypothetical protein OG585_10825 [Streptomyces sp. NBC_01340]|uniref:hypothetical protein n=1 Tax=unclassified Streptomyces TaxID=2593676 RepID=UPI00224CB9EF|nr:MULTISPECIES: hypothetical protein [unclassified Streptomyces]MCX4453214.1 hypothetical protein [Streptomyces sp. NBC_01719]MCX4492574.1 hypothetical protein [Streptomyces sp. NBC_01728]WSI37731.1 hypothetical protein OG585_10825 [Streptomyces sp. NBC_01340]
MAPSSYAFGGPAPDEGPNGRPAPAARALLPVAVALLLTAAHEARPASYGDRLIAHTRVAHGHGTRQPPPRATKAAVEAYVSSPNVRCVTARRS